MISSLGKILAAQGNKEWFDILIPLAIAAVYLIVSILRKKGETQQGGDAAEKPRSRPLDQSMRQKQQSRQNSYEDQSNPAAIRQAAQREFDEAKELARRQFDDRMERIREYEQNKPIGVPEAVWKKQIDNARMTVQREYDQAQQQAREEYLRVVGRLPAAPSPPARKTPPQPQKPVAVHSTPQQPPGPSQPAPVAPAHAGQKAKTVDVLAYHLSFTNDDLTKGILYSEILGKPLALREDA